MSRKQKKSSEEKVKIIRQYQQGEIIKSHIYTSKSYLVTSTSTVPSQEKLMDLASSGV